MLAALLAEAPVTRAPGSVRPPVKLDQVALALPAPDEVRSLDALLAAIEERAERARRQLDPLDEVGHIAVTGLAAGDLALTSDSRTLTS